MNIDKIYGNVRPKPPSTGRTAGGEKRFEQILKDAVHHGVHQGPSAAEATPTVGPALPVSWDHRNVDPLVFKQAHDILDLLEEYSKALNSPDMTLKRIEPIVTRIEQELNGLDVQSLDNLAQNDELANIINDIAVTASVEAFKFQRGDYLA